MVIEPPLFLREHEVIHSDLAFMRYRVQIRIIQVQDWNEPPSSPSDGGPGPDDSDDPEWGFGVGGRSGPWPRSDRFAGDDAGGDAEDGAAPEPDPALGSWAMWLARWALCLLPHRAPLQKLLQCRRRARRPRTIWWDPMLLSIEELELPPPSITASMARAVEPDITACERVLPVPAAEE